MMSKYIQSTVIAEERKQKIFTLKKLESQNFDFSLSELQLYVKLRIFF